MLLSNLGSSPVCYTLTLNGLVYLQDRFSSQSPNYCPINLMNFLCYLKSYQYHLGLLMFFGHVTTFFKKKKVKDMS